MTKNVGARSRKTRHIGHRVTQSAFRAFDYAKHTGRRLNTYVVINLRDEATCGAVTAFGRIRHKYRDWLTHKARKLGPVPPIYIYTFENPNGHMHVNWVLHVPMELEKEFEKKLPIWIKKVQGPLGPYDLRAKPVHVDYDKRLAKHVLKGTDQRYVRHFFLEDVYEGEQGEVSGGRRAGISQAIGVRARKKAQYHPGKRRPYQPIPAHVAASTGHGAGHPAR